MKKYFLLLFIFILLPILGSSLLNKSEEKNRKQEFVEKIEISLEYLNFDEKNIVLNESLSSYETISVQIECEKLPREEEFTASSLEMIKNIFENNNAELYEISYSESSFSTEFSCFSKNVVLYDPISIFLSDEKKQFSYSRKNILKNSNFIYCFFENASKSTEREKIVFKAKMNDNETNNINISFSNYFNFDVIVKYKAFSKIEFNENEIENNLLEKLEKYKYKIYQNDLTYLDGKLITYSNSLGGIKKNT